VIAAVNGTAVAGGFEMMLACDIAVVADHAVFGIPEAKRGLLAAGGGLVKVPRRLPLAIALEMALTGDTFSAQRAYELGLVNRVLPGPLVLAEALAIAEKIAANGPRAIRLSKEVIYASSAGTEADGWAAMTGASAQIFGSADAKEGATAFVEKRSPNWTET
jgi:enoyl-CoA hydratase